MRPFVLNPNDYQTFDDLAGSVVCQDIRLHGKARFRKGHQLSQDDFADLREIERPFHAVKLEPGDIHEDEAGRRLAAAIAGSGVDIRSPVQSRVNLVASTKGLLRIDEAALLSINSVPDVSVFTLIDRLPVVPGKNVAGAKITPVATSNANIERAEQIAASATVITVKPFHPLIVGVVTTEEMDEKTAHRFRQAVETKVSWFGGSVLRFVDLHHDQVVVAASIDDLVHEGATLILAGGGSSIDPFDPTLDALAQMGAEMVSVGVPAHPGSMFWIGYLGETPILNLASCSMYSQATVADLVLPWVMAGERVTPADIAALGYGGLLDRDMRFRFPDYTSGEATEAGDLSAPEEVTRHAPSAMALLGRSLADCRSGVAIHSNFRDERTG